MAQDAAPYSAERTRVLIIDDDGALCDTLRWVLEHAGYRVNTAHDGESGLATFEKNGADVVVTDILMPQKEGIETILELRRLVPNLPIIAISGGAEAFLGLASKFGANAALSKPFGNWELITAIECCLAGATGLFEADRGPGAGRLMH